MAEKEENKVKDIAENIKEETKKAAEAIKEDAKKVYSSEDDMAEKIIDFIKNNAGLLIGLLVGIILVATNIAKFLLNVLIILASTVIGYYIQKKINEKNNQ